MEISFILKVAGIGFVVAILNQVLTKSGREEYALLTVFSGVLVIIILIIPEIGSLISSIENTFGL